MKQSRYEWYVCLAQQLRNLGFEANERDDTIFTRQTQQGQIFIALYVDDLFLVAENEQVLKNFKEDLENHFDLKYFGQVSEYLGNEFKRTGEGYEMSQHKFLRELANDFLRREE